MPHRALWSVLDVAGLVCLGQAMMLAQRQAAAPLPLDPIAEVRRAGDGVRAAATRIAETADAVVITVALPGGEEPAQVLVEGTTILLLWKDGRSSEIPVPASAEPSRRRVSRLGSDLRLVFRRRT